MSSSATTYPPAPITAPSSSSPTLPSIPPAPSSPSKDSSGISNGQAISPTALSQSALPNNNNDSATKDSILAALNLGPVIPFTSGPSPNASEASQIGSLSSSAPATGTVLPRSESLKQSIVRKLSQAGRGSSPGTATQPVPDKEQSAESQKEGSGVGSGIPGAGTALPSSTEKIAMIPVGGGTGIETEQDRKEGSPVGTDPSSLITSAPQPPSQVPNTPPTPIATATTSVPTPRITTNPAPTSSTPNPLKSQPPAPNAKPTITATPATPVIANSPEAGSIQPAASGGAATVTPGNKTPLPKPSTQAKPSTAAATPSPSPRKKKKQGGLAAFFASLGCGSSKHLEDEEHVSRSSATGTGAGSGSGAGQRLQKQKQAEGTKVGSAKIEPGQAVGNGTTGGIGGSTPGTKPSTTTVGGIGTSSSAMQNKEISNATPIRTEASPASPLPASASGATSAGVAAGVGAATAVDAYAATRGHDQGSSPGDKASRGQDASSSMMTGASVAGREESGIAVVVPPAVSSETLPMDETEGMTSAAVQPPGSGSAHLHPHHPHPHTNPNSSAPDAARSQGDSTEISDDSFLTETSSDLQSAGAVQQDGQQQAGAFPLMEEDEMDDEDRLISQGGIGIPIDMDGKPAPLLPPMSAEHRGRKCLVLDLDETLLHSSFKMIPSADFIVPVEIESMTHNVYVIKRPGVDNFLRRMGEIYEVVVFTASLSKYADPVLDILDTERVVKHRLFRESCYNHKGNYVKDLSQLGREMNTTIIIDNSPASYIFHPNNAVPVSTWFNDPHDTELTDLCPFLADLEQVDDIRGVLDGSW